eukprot:sb/3475997/
MGDHPAVQKVSSQTFNLALKTLAARPIGEENKVPGHIDPQQLYEAVDEQAAIEQKMDPQVEFESMKEKMNECVVVARVNNIEFSGKGCTVMNANEKAAEKIARAFEVSGHFVGVLYEFSYV